MRTLRILRLVFILTLLSIEISSAINFTDTTRSVNESIDPSVLVPNVETIKNNTWIFPAISCILTLIILLYGPNIRDRIRPKPLDREREARRGEFYRQEMISQVRNVWINNFLFNSLFTMELGLDECQDKIDLTEKVVVQQPNNVSRSLPSSAKILEIFDELGKSFLILGEPGSGKTILLLQLTRSLLDRAEGDEKHPIPVVLHGQSDDHLWLIG